MFSTLLVWLCLNVGHVRALGLAVQLLGELLWVSCQKIRKMCFELTAVRGDLSSVRARTRLKLGDIGQTVFRS